jgi:hypothetical protein
MAENTSSVGSSRHAPRKRFTTPHHVPWTNASPAGLAFARTRERFARSCVHCTSQRGGDPAKVTVYRSRAAALKSARTLARGSRHGLPETAAAATGSVSRRFALSLLALQVSSSQYPARAGPQRKNDSTELRRRACWSSGTAMAASYMLSHAASKGSGAPAKDKADAARAIANARTYASTPTSPTSAASCSLKYCSSNPAASDASLGLCSGSKRPARRSSSASRMLGWRTSRDETQ